MFLDEKFRENVEYMTRIIFLGGNLNRRQDIFKSFKNGPGPSEHENIILKIILCHNVQTGKNSEI